MARSIAILGWRPTPLGLGASIFVISGFLLCDIHWGFLALTALGTFGPGILRELGIVKDQDEFQRRAARRAGYHAYLIGGFITFLLVTYFRMTEPQILNPGELIEVILVILWFTWLLSSLLSYWGARKSATRILISFGIVWLIFNVISNIGLSLALIMQSLLAVPFFALAFVARRWRRVGGILLILASAFFFHFFKMFRTPNLQIATQVMVFVLFIGPLLSSGIALLRAGDPDED
jgi:hypothetical protein